MNWSAVGAVLLGIAVIMGAFGAHGLRNRLDTYSMGVYEKAALYHFIHALGLLIVSVLPRTGLLSQSGSAWVCALLFAGIIVFSGSLYVLAMTGIKTFGAITPLGGLSFIVGWFLLTALLLRGVPR